MFGDVDFCDVIKLVLFVIGRSYVFVIDGFIVVVVENVIFCIWVILVGWKCNVIVLVFEFGDFVMFGFVVSGYVFFDIIIIEFDVIGVIVY